jgi:hypothetical protein
VAGHAIPGRPVRSSQRHAHRELAAMEIRVAGWARQTITAIRDATDGVAFFSLVALDAGNGNMRTRESESRRPVAYRGECGRGECLHGMA